MHHKKYGIEPTTQAVCVTYVAAWQDELEEKMEDRPTCARATSATKCLGYECAKACYHPDDIEPHHEVLWCRETDSAVIELVSCPNSHLRKYNNRPYSAFFHEDCPQFVGMPVPFLKDATKNYQYPKPHCCQTKTCVSALSACPLGKPEIVREKTE